jgi:hypothetical protein
MRIVRTASEAEVIATFLRAELDSPRYGEQLLALLREDGVNASVLSRPNIADAGESRYRETLLDRHRGWLRRDGLFDGLPERIDWWRAALAAEEVLAIRYINWDWWLRLSGGTRQPLDAAERIRHNSIAGVTAESHEPIAATLASSTRPPELIAVAPPDHSRLVLVEGHVRLTAYALYPEYLPDELEMFLGTAAEIDRWSEF